MGVYALVVGGPGPAAVERDSCRWTRIRVRCVVGVWSGVGVLLPVCGVTILV